MRSLLMVFLLAFVSLQLLTTTVDAELLSVWVQDEWHPGVAGYFSASWIGLKLDQMGHASVTFFSGNHAYGDYVISTNLGGNAAQSGTFDTSVPTQATVNFVATGTYWVYLSQAGSTANVDYIQIRVVPYEYNTAITMQYFNPPAFWTTGYPPAAAWLESSASTPAIAPPPSSASSSVSVWLAPLLVGLVMAALTVPIAMVAYKKGKTAGRGQEMDKEQQQQHTLNHIQVQNSV